MKLANLEGDPKLVYPPREDKFSLEALLQGSARETGRDFAKGAIEGATGSVAKRAGIQLLAPEYATSF